MPFPVYFLFPEFIVFSCFPPPVLTSCPNSLSSTMDNASQSSPDIPFIHPIKLSAVSGGLFAASVVPSFFSNDSRFPWPPNSLGVPSGSRSHSS
eukprot:g39549.t1